MSSSRRVLVATDLSRASDAAFTEALERVAGPEDALAAVHVLPPHSTIAALFAHRHAPSTPDERALLARAKDGVQTQIARVTRAAGLPSRPVEIFIDEGSDYAQILKRAEDWHADILVLGSHGRSEVSRLLGGVAERVSRHAPCTVLLSRPHAARGPVLAATDMSEPSLRAVAAAAREAKRRRTPLKVVQARGFLDVEASFVIESASPYLLVQPPQDNEIAARELREAVAKLGVEAECEVLYGSPAPSVVREAETIGAELIVIAAHGRTGLARLSLGGVADRIVRGAHCSVQVVRAVS